MAYFRQRHEPWFIDASPFDPTAYGAYPEFEFDHQDRSRTPRRKRFQVPEDRPTWVSQMICLAPPWRSILESLPAAKNATERLSGDQKAESTNSVPSSGSAVSELRARIQSCRRPSGPAPMNTRRSPSGETEKESMSGDAIPSGGEICMRMTRSHLPGARSCNWNG